MNKISAVLLLIGGTVHALPQVYTLLTELTGGVPLVQIVAGSVSVLFGIALLMQKPVPARS